MVFERYQVERHRPTRTAHDDYLPFTIDHLLPLVQINFRQTRSVLQDERVVGQRLVYLDRGGVLEHDAYRVVILRSRQLDLRGQAQAAISTEGLRVAVDHVRYQLPALVVALHAREPERADAVEPEASKDARAVGRRRLKLGQDVVAVYDARALLRGGARVRLLLERLGDGVDVRRAFERDGLDE